MGNAVTKQRRAFPEGFALLRRVAQGMGVESMRATTTEEFNHQFAYCMANNLAPLLKQYPHWSIAEIGPGRGEEWRHAGRVSPDTGQSLLHYP